MDEEKFKDIFTLGKIIDIDLSQWDRRLRLVVIAMEETDLAENGYLPIYAVDFEKLSHLDMDIFHLNGDVEGYYQWNATLKSIATENGAYVIQLSGIPELAGMKIVCSDVAVTPVKKSVIDAVCPGWDKPRSPLARAGILEMAARKKAN
jgi:hypothetical protein